VEAVAHDQAVPVLVALVGVDGDVGVDLSLQCFGPHPASTLSNDLVDQRRRISDSGQFVVSLVGQGFPQFRSYSQPRSFAAIPAWNLASTRTNGSGLFSSGFGTRINVSAPSGGIPSFEHPNGGTPQQVATVLNGGTSASAPMTAAAAAVVLQAARLTGQQATPDSVRSLLESTGRAVATPAQADQNLNVGPQIDVTAAVNAVFGHQAGTPAIVRVSVAHRQTIGGLGGSFTEATDPSTIDLAGPNGTGEGLVGPVTIAADVTGTIPGQPTYALRIGGQEFDSATCRARVRQFPHQRLRRYRPGRLGGTGTGAALAHRR
jgi:hypothetical protein